VGLGWRLDRLDEGLHALLRERALVAPVSRHLRAPDGGTTSSISDGRALAIVEPTWWIGGSVRDLVTDRHKRGSRGSWCEFVTDRPNAQGNEPENPSHALLVAAARPTPHGCGHCSR
jgi:hypothetical protein